MREDLPFCVRLNRHFHACSEQVFDAFLRPDAARHFLFATPQGEMVVAVVEARVGGAFNFTERRGDAEVAHTGIYLDLDRPHRLAFSLRVNQDATNTDRVVIDLMPRGGGCDLTLTHQLHPQWQEYGERTRRGWDGILDGLAQTLARR